MALPNPEDSFDLIRLRRTLKPVDMDPSRDISRELLERLFEAANWAPNHGATEPWRWQVFLGEGRRQLTENLPRLYDEVTAAKDVKPEKRDKLGKLPLLAPVVSAIIVSRGSNPKIPEIEETEAVACAVQNISLLAASEELGSFWSSPPLVYTRVMADWLGLSESEQCLGLLYLGYPAEGKSGAREAVRCSPGSDKVIWKEEAP